MPDIETYTLNLPTNFQNTFRKIFNFNPISTQNAIYRMVNLKLKGFKF